MILRYMKLAPKGFAFAFLFLALVDLLQILIPIILRQAIDQLTQQPSPAVFLWLGIALTILAVLIYLLRFVWRWLLMRSAITVVTWLRERFYRKLLSFSQDFHSTAETGDLMARATNDLNAVRGLFSFGFVSIFDMIFMGTASLLSMLFIDWKLTLIAIIPLPFLILVVLSFEQKIHNTFKKVQEKFSILTTSAQEMLAGIFVVKSFVREKAEAERFAVKNEDFVKHNLHLAKLNALFDPMLALPTAISTIVVLYFGGKSVIEGHFSVGELVAFIAYLDMLSWPVMALGFSVSIYQRGTASLKRIEEITEREPESPDRPDAYKLIVGRPLSIEIRNLNFQYESHPVLKELTLSIPAGQKVGILGRIGSGKSTLIRALLKMRKIPDGHIFVDGIDINQCQMESLRSRISCVPQETFLFSTTVAENIAFYEPEAPIERIQRAATIADIANTIETFPQGYQTLLGERGVNLSGGQKQRIAIARAILKDFSILIFDDSFSAIDTETESRILDSLKPEMDAATTLIITHKVATLRYVERILVMDDGRIIEDGTHEDLLARKGHYATIHRRQQIEERLAGEYR